MREAADRKTAQKAIWERWEAGEIFTVPGRTQMAGGEDFAAGFATLRVEGVAIREGAAGVRCDAPVHGLLASGGIG